MKNKNIVDVKNNVYFSVALDLVTDAACHSNEAMKKIVSLLVKFYMVHTLSDCQYPCKKICLGTFSFCAVYQIWHSLGRLFEKKKTVQYWLEKNSNTYHREHNFIHQGKKLWLVIKLKKKEEKKEVYYDVYIS